MWVLTVSVVFGSYLLPWTSTLLLTEGLILGVFEGNTNHCSFSAVDSTNLHV